MGICFKNNQQQHTTKIYHKYNYSIKYNFLKNCFLSYGIIDKAHKMQIQEVPNPDHVIRACEAAAMIPLLVLLLHAVPLPWRSKSIFRPHKIIADPL